MFHQTRKKTNGALLGWLIAPFNKTVYIYRPSKKVETIQQPTSVSGDPELPGFMLPLEKIFS